MLLAVTLIGVAMSGGDDDGRSIAGDDPGAGEPQTPMWDPSATQEEVLGSIEADFCSSVNLTPMPHLGNTWVSCFLKENPQSVVTFYVYPDAETYEIAVSAGIACQAPNNIVVHGPTWMAESANPADVVPLVRAGGTQDTCE